MSPSQFCWSPTAEDFTRHQLSHVTNFWQQGRAAEFRLKALPSGQAELSLTFQLPSPSESVPPPNNPALVFPPRNLVRSPFPQSTFPQRSDTDSKARHAFPKVTKRQRKNYRRSVLHRATLAAPSLPPPKNGSLRQAAEACVQRLQADQASHVITPNAKKRPLCDSPNVLSPSNCSPLAQRIRSDFQISENEVESPAPERELLRTQCSPLKSPKNSSCISPPGVKGFPPPAPLVFTPSKNQDVTETPVIGVKESAEGPIYVDKKACKNVKEGDVEKKEVGLSGWKAKILRKLEAIRNLPAEEINVELRKVMEEKRRFEMEEEMQKEIDKKGKTPDCWNCGEVFSPDHQCFQPT